MPTRYVAECPMCGREQGVVMAPTQCRLIVRGQRCARCGAPLDAAVPKIGTAKSTATMTAPTDAPATEPSAVREAAEAMFTAMLRETNWDKVPLSKKAAIMAEVLR